MMTLLGRQEALKQLTGVYGMRQDHAIRALTVAECHDVTAESTTRGPVTIRAKHNGKEQYEIEDGIPPEAAGRPAGVGYNSTKSRATKPPKKETTMPKGRQAAPPAEENGTDLSVYAEKEPTVKMVDYHEWLEGQLGQKLDLHSLYVGVTLYPHFQRSDFNRTRTAERRAARAAEQDEAPAPDPKPAGRGRGRAAAQPKAAAGGTTGRRAGSAPATGRGRGRGAKAGAAAPF